jgi:hypothetical protein
MLIALIFFGYIFSGFAGFLLRKRGVRTAYIWILFVFISLILWLLVIIVPKDSFSPLIIGDWFRIGEKAVKLSFSLTSQNWILAVALLAFNLAYFSTGIARLNIKIDLQYWVTQLIFTAFSFLAILSADLWSLILLWTALDLLDFIFQRYIRKKNLEISYFRRLIFKIFGIMLLIWNISILSKTGTSLLLVDLKSSFPNFSLFLSAFLHSGIFPLDSESEKNSDEDAGKLLNSTFKIICFVVSFSLVLYLSTPEFPFLISILINLITYLLIFTAMTQWILKKDLEDSLNFLLIGVASFFVFLYLSNGSQFIAFWLAILIFSILWLFLYSHRGKKLTIFPIISTFLLTGLPFSLNAFGQRGFIGNDSFADIFILIGMQVLFLIGYIKSAFQENDEFIDLEVWYQASYLAGLFIMLLSVAAIVFSFFNSIENEINYWWMGVIAFALSLIGYLFAIRKNYFNSLSNNISGSKLTWLWELLKFEWVFNIMSFIESKASGTINGLSGLLEGEGGILWALVLLLLILTIIK